MARGRSHHVSKARITTLAGGVGAAKFIRGLVRIIDPRQLTIIGNTGDDEQFFGLYVSPDLDTVSYTLAGVVNSVTGWGLAHETFHALDAAARFYGKPWFNLGDRDMATHLYRTERLARGVALSQVTAEIAKAFGIKARILPMSDDPVHTHVKLRGKRPMPFQEYFVRGRALGFVEGIELHGIEDARPAPGVIETITSADAVILAPSNPFVSIEPIIGVQRVRDSLRSKRRRVAAITPIVGGKPIKGPLDKMMRGLGHEVSPVGVARLYRDFCGSFVLDERDKRHADKIENLGMKAILADTIMSTPARSARLAGVVLNALAL